jgi:hypothetical protein
MEAELLGALRGRVTPAQAPWSYALDVLDALEAERQEGGE